ncbi:hypothetical protein GOP47_0024083 [Adiantum capillus-veneris]|uniref:LOB domain-containing protein n=1 Tax=Adiantum capillus-veneris TaxID=13818 RepID=A0A9D4U5X5_ADICA|nr:hypothetical protein GOP47_0024083 [Adiantum capillus-veneris]
MSKEREATGIEVGGRSSLARAAEGRALAKQQINVKHSFLKGELQSRQASCSSDVYPVKGAMQIGSGLGTAPPQQSVGVPGLQQYQQTPRHVHQQGGMMLNTSINNHNHMMVMTSVNNINTSTPCAACKLLRRRCAQECPFAPYFSPHEPQRFASVHKIYGASNVSKMLLEVPEMQRADTANSLVYEANARLRDPVYGCMGLLSTLQQQAQALQAELNAVKGEVMRYRVAAAAAAATPTCSSQAVTAAICISTTPAAPTTPPQHRQLALDHHPTAVVSRSSCQPTVSSTPADHHHYVLANTISTHIPSSSSTAPSIHLPQDRFLPWP